MLMEELFKRKIMTMGPCRLDPQRQVGVFNMELVGGFRTRRLAEMEKMRWLEGEWICENSVPATRHNPAYVDLNPGTFKFCESGGWICRVAPTGKETQFITFDPFSEQWMYVLAEGAYGIMRSSGWTGNQIVFTGPMMMIGVHCDLRQTWTKISDDEYRFVNDEMIDGKWVYADEWHMRRK